jgi:hypothetical protein
LEEWGFVFYGLKKEDERVYTKNISLDHVNIENPRLTYPYVGRRGPRKFIVPIYPEYHTELFPDSILSNESPVDFMENEPYRNAIKKVYISRSYDRSMVSGDLVVFYRTGGNHRGVVSTLGVIESVITNIGSQNEFINLARRRSVFSNEGLAKFWNHNPRSRPFVVNFLYIQSFPMPKINLIKLTKSGIIASAPRGFEQIMDNKFNDLIKLTNTDESNFID